MYIRINIAAAEARRLVYTKTNSIDEAWGQSILFWDRSDISTSKYTANTHAHTRTASARHRISHSLLQWHVYRWWYGG